MKEAHGDTAAAARQPAPVVIVTGPTASGKSALALALAGALGGVIVNADAMQVYRELAVLTARPGPADLAAAPHRLYGLLPGAQACSAGQWLDMALSEIAEAHAGGRLPILVGGTGLYLRALACGLAPLPPIPEALREAARARHRQLGGPAFHAELAGRDPVMAARLRPGDSQRLIRAWEVLEATGRSLADWQAADRDRDGEGPDAAPYRFLRLHILPPRAELYVACDARFRRMVEAGALDEVRALLALGLDPALPVMKSLGVPELAAHLRGELDLETAILQVEQATRRYAKRQMTWLRTQAPRDLRPNDPTPIVINEQYSESTDGNIVNFIRDLALTAQL